MEIKKVYKESLPNVKLIGKRYSNKDRDEHGTFASYWQECFKENWFDTLKERKAIAGVSEEFCGGYAFG